jgi:hypothetical protein
MLAAQSGYAELVLAGKLLKGTQIFDPGTIPADTEIADYLELNRLALDAAHQALQIDCQVPLIYEVSFIEQSCSDSAVFRNVSRSFSLEITAAEQRRDFVTAMRSGLDLLRLANGISRGGLMMHFLTGMAIDAVVLDRLLQLRSQLNSIELDFLAKSVIQITAARDPLDAFIQREEKWGQLVPQPDEAEIIAEMQQHYIDEEQLDAKAAKKFRKEMNRILNEEPKGEPWKMYRDFDERSREKLRLLASGAFEARD